MLEHRLEALAHYPRFKQPTPRFERLSPCCERLSPRCERLSPRLGAASPHFKALATHPQTLSAPQPHLETLTHHPLFFRFELLEHAIDPALARTRDPALARPRELALARTRDPALDRTRDPALARPRELALARAREPALVPARAPARARTAGFTHAHTAGFASPLARASRLAPALALLAGRLAPGLASLVERFALGFELRADGPQRLSQTAAARRQRGWGRRERARGAAFERREHAGGDQIERLEDALTVHGDGRHGGRALRVQHAVEVLDGQDVGQVALVVLKDDRQPLELAPLFEQVVAQVLEALEVRVRPQALRVGHEDHAVGAGEHQLAGRVVVHLPRHGEELQAHAHAPQGRHAVG